MKYTIIMLSIYGTFRITLVKQLDTILHVKRRRAFRSLY